MDLVVKIGININYTKKKFKTLGEKPCKKGSEKKKKLSIKREKLLTKGIKYSIIRIVKKKTVAFFYQRRAAVVFLTFRKRTAFLCSFIGKADKKQSGNKELK